MLLQSLKQPFDKLISPMGKRICSCTLAIWSWIIILMYKHATVYPDPVFNHAMKLLQLSFMNVSTFKTAQIRLCGFLYAIGFLLIVLQLWDISYAAQIRIRGYNNFSENMIRRYVLLFIKK